MSSYPYPVSPPGPLPEPPAGPPVPPPPAMAGEDAMRLNELAGEVGAAAAHVATYGTDDQVDRAARLLDDVRAALYRLLAETERR